MSFRVTKTIDKSDLPGLYRKLKGMMQNVSFEAQMLNIAVLRNAKTIQEDAERLINEKERIFGEYAEHWGEGEDLPDGAEIGGRKSVDMGGGVTRPKYPNRESRLEAENELNDLFEGTSEYTFEQVPVEAFEVPDGSPIAVWDGLDFMFKRQDADSEG